ncbi:hypothetical protein GXW78_18185 [Roseomonas terrae]|uniref:Transposase n=1 Tax=Neoroseomonas terrae TaxID=424799 RepID=A0ABS5EKX0_9PROT|nr:hypothetical protein [Neoroseomonas terrae]MBR0651605.1 hypothetical protein [Neoroseomonas terrae]
MSDNVTLLLPLPAKWTELNVVDNVWQFMRDSLQSNRVFHDNDGIVDHYCHHRQRLVDQPWRIMSIGLREWAHVFRSAGIGIRAHPASLD